MRLDDSHGGQVVTLLLDPASAMDVAALVIDGTDLSPGDAIPSDGDPRIDQALKGFLFTCGPDHIRHPEPTDGGGRYPLHGSLSGTPVDRTPWEASDTTCRAMVDIALADGGKARLDRRWSIKQGSVHLRDRVENIGDRPFPPMWMYHINIAGRFFDDQTRISGAMIPNGAMTWRFGDGESAHVLFPAGAVSLGPDGWAKMRVGPFAALANRSLDISFKTDGLPFLQMWRCQRDAADVVSIEPVSHRIAKRSELSQSGALVLLMPGAAIAYELMFGLVDAAGADRAD
ncbi:DUF4432 family protein [Rhizobium sp. Leaf341]|uniref:DUF4432 family protein n=1 Tax=Rhizobium sp. Leaf341 TaxID=1736344 RepID=UPI0007131320|nr:DUF4432 family protein [Rhizobium sp. Leaf341]KQR69019.1 hypothetical protein ASG03_07280 [Rhizobium sp. Leaf341]